MSAHQKGPEEATLDESPALSRSVYYVKTSGGRDRICEIGMDNAETVIFENPKNLFIGKLAVSPDGNALAFAHEIDAAGPTDSTISLIDLANRAATPEVLTKGDWPDWSPDGTRIVFQRETGKYLPEAADVEIFEINLTTGTITQLTDVAGSSYSGLPAWSPDGSTIAYTRSNPREPNCRNERVIHLMTSSGSPVGPLTCQNKGFYKDTASAWSPDGSEIAFTRKKSAAGRFELYKISVTTGELTKLTDSGACDEIAPAWSASDAATIAVGSNRDGDHDIWLVDSESGVYKLNLTNANPDIDALPVFGR